MSSRKIKALEIVALAHDGSGIGFIDASANSRGKAIFVQDALPGQTVECEIMRDKGRRAEARLLSVLASSFEPELPCCPHLHECGGCPLQTLPYDTQLIWKERLVRDALERIGGFSREELDCSWVSAPGCIAMPRERNKVELAFGCNSAGALALGFRKRASHQVFQLQKCALLPQTALRLIEHCREVVLELGISAEILRFLTLRKSADGLWTSILLTGKASGNEKAKIRKLGARLLDDMPELEQFIHEEREKHDLLAIGQKRLLVLRKDGRKVATMRMSLRGRDFCIDPASFFQVNQPGAECLATAVMRNADPAETLLDLYCGSGSPGQLLADRSEHCLGIEQDERAINFARLNATGLPGWEYTRGKVEVILEKEEIKKKAFATALLDPPRAGLGYGAIRRLIAMAPEQIIYVSCNPATLARDGAVLRERYRLCQIQLVDMFPDTPHVECCAVWASKI